MISITPLRLSRNGEANSAARPSIEQLRQEVRRASDAVGEYVERSASCSEVPYFKDFEHGLGHQVKQWFNQAPVPKGDGEVLITLVDGKGAPTATHSELLRRRGKRKQRSKAPSPRHRGRDKRQRWPSRPRRKKGDKSKNA